MKITLYHGSTLSIEHPLAKVGRADLDFGRGFYLTSLRSQAEQWAARVQLLRASTTAWINVYEFDMDAAIKAVFKLLRFDAYDQHWLNFIVASRNGKQPWKDYDIIEGGVANDRALPPLMISCFIMYRLSLIYKIAICVFKISDFRLSLSRVIFFFLYRDDLKKNSSIRIMA